MTLFRSDLKKIFPVFCRHVLETALLAKSAVMTDFSSGFNVNFLALTRFTSPKALVNVFSSATIVGCF